MLSVWAGKGRQEDNHSHDSEYDVSIPWDIFSIRFKRQATLLSTPLSLSMSLSLSVYVCLYLPLPLCLCLSLSLSLSVSASVSLSLSLSMSVSVCLCLSVSVSLFLSLSLSFSLSLSLSLYLSLSLSLSLAVNVCLSDCLPVCLFSNQPRSLPLVISLFYLPWLYIYPCQCVFLSTHSTSKFTCPLAFFLCLSVAARKIVRRQSWDIA